MSRCARSSGEDCWLEFSMTNHLDDPAVAGIVINHRDVTARRAAEDSIRFQADLLDAAGQAIIGTDRQGRILFWNKAATRMYGWTRDEIVGRFVQHVVPPIDSDAQMRRDLRLHRPGRDLVRRPVDPLQGSNAAPGVHDHDPGVRRWPESSSPSSVCRPTSPNASSPRASSPGWRCTIR